MTDRPTDSTMLADRALLRLSGEDAGEFLQSLITNDVGKVAAGAPAWAALLTPQGKVLFDFILWADGEDFLVDCEASARDDLARRLTLYRLRRPIRIEPEGSLAVHWSLAPDREAPDDPRLPALGKRWLAPPGSPTSGWRRHRLELGVTEGAAELGSGSTLWLECNAAELNGVSFTKGCYVGQENTARMMHRSKVNRRLVVLRTGEAGPRTRFVHEDLGLAVEHRRIDDLGEAIIPDWLAAALG